MFVFSALLPKELATFAFVVLGLNYDLHIVFYVVFCNFRKILTLIINQLKFNLSNFLEQPIR